MLKKRALALILSAFVIAGAVTGCSGKSKTSSGSLATKDSNINLSGTGPIIKDPSKFPKMTMVNIVQADCKVKTGDMAMVQKIGKQTGVYFNWKTLPIEGATEKINLMLSSGDLPDAFWSFGDGKSSNTVVQYADQNVFVPTEGLINKYMPRLKKILQDHPQYAKQIVAPNGHSYGFPYIEEMKGLVLTPGPFLINQTWLDKVGKKMPTTVDEWVDCLKAFRDAKDLNGNGKNDEVPYALGFGSTDTFGSYNTFYRFTGAFGCADSYCGGNSYADHLRVIDGKIEFTAENDAFKKTAEFFNSLYKQKLIDPDSFSLGTDSSTPLFLNKIKQNVAQVGSFGVWGDQEVTNQTVHDQYKPIPKLKGEDGTTGFILNYSQMQDSSDLAITTKCKYPEVIARFVDDCYEPINSITMNWGAIGYNYTQDSNGMLHFPLDANGHIICKSPYTSFGEMRDNSTPARGSYAVLDSYYGTKTDYTYDAKQLLADQIVNGKEEDLKNYTAVPKMMMTTDELNRLSQIQPNIDNIVNRYISQWVMEGNAESTWSQYKKDLDAAGLPEVLKIFNTAYTRFNKTK